MVTSRVLQGIDDRTIRRLLKSDLAERALHDARVTDVMMRKNTTRCRREEMAVRNRLYKPKRDLSPGPSKDSLAVTLVRCSSLPRERKTLKVDEHIFPAPHCFFHEKEPGGDLKVERKEYDAWVQKTAPQLPPGGSQPTTPELRLPPLKKVTSMPSLPVRPRDPLSQMRVRRAFRECLTAQSEAFIKRELDYGDELQVDDLHELCETLTITSLSAKDLSDLCTAVQGSIGNFIKFLDLPSIPPDDSGGRKKPKRKRKPGRNEKNSFR